MKIKSKTRETVRQFMGVGPEWDAVVVKTATGYDAICKRTRGSEVQYGHTLCSFRYKKNAEKAAKRAMDIRNQMLAKAYP